MKKKYYYFKMNDKTINIIPILILFIVIGIIYLIDSDYLIKLKDILFDKPCLIIALIILYSIIHELFHSLAYIVHRIPFDKITYGLALEKGVFYCLCKQNIERNMILRALLYPFFFLGILTLIIGIIFNVPLLVILSIYNIAGCSGDLIMFAYIVKLNKNVEFSEFDDPVSFTIYTDKDVSKVKHFGLDYLKCSEEIKRKDLKKIKISKYSLIAVIIIVLMVVLEELI